MGGERMDEIKRQIEAGTYESPLRVAGTVRDMTVVDLHKRNLAAIGLLAMRAAGDSGYDEVTWPKIKAAIERNRLSSRPRFADTPDGPDWDRWHELLDIRDKCLMTPSERVEYQAFLPIVARLDEQSMPRFAPEETVK